MAVIGIDLGGTKLASALLAEEGTALHKNVVALEGRGGPAVGRLIQEQIRELLAQADSQCLPVAAVGISVPGISHARSGRVWAPNIPGWDDYPLQQDVLEALKEKPVGVTIDSDRACCILGEAWQGAARGCANAIFLAVGTGIGAGIMVNGEILRGAQDVAGAMGWLALARPFRHEYVSVGCFEYHASGAGLVRVARALLAQTPDYTGPLQHKPHLTAQDLFAAYELGDRIAGEVLSHAVEFWGMAAANLVSLFNPEKLIFGGGVFGPAVHFLDAIYAEARKWAQPISIGQVKFEASRLGADAALIGAGYLALRSLVERG